MKLFKWIKEKAFKWTKLKLFKWLVILGIAIIMFSYVTVTWLGDFMYNPKTQNISAWIYSNLPFIVYLNTHMVELDLILFSGVILALIGTFLMYKEKKGSIYAIQKTLFIYSVFISTLIFFTVDVTKWLATSLFGVGVSITGFPAWNYGFPTWTYAVTTITGFWKYPDFNYNNPNVYFLNYWQLFTICICIAIATGFLMRRRELKKQQIV